MRHWELLGVCVLLGWCGAVFAQEPVPQTHAAFAYPPILRVSHFSGDAVVNYVIDGSGKVTSAEGVSGSPIALRAAIEQVKSWTFSAQSDVGEHQVLFHFHLEPRAEDDDSSEINEFSSYTAGRVDVLSTAPDQMRRSGCPQGTERLVPQNESPADWVDTGWPGLRVLSSGEVLWDPPGDWDSPDWTRATKAKIAPEAAQELIARFRTEAYWKLCASYDTGATDTSTNDLQVSLGGVARQVSVHGDPAPDAFTALRNAIHEATNSHQWRVGDPAKEQMGDMASDVWLPKPGRTQLMADAYHGRQSVVRADLAQAGDVNVHDASGWTALMYAGSSYSGEEGSVTRLLLDKGADVNARGLHGETALHFAALRGEAEEELLAAGADVNAATHEGVTALMLLAQRADAKELKTLLDAGAKATAKDTQGRTATDYLEAANCNRALVVRDTHPWMTYTGSTCREFELDDLSSARAVLQYAGAVATQHWSAVMDVPVNSSVGTPLIP